MVTKENKSRIIHETILNDEIIKQLNDELAKITEMATLTSINSQGVIKYDLKSEKALSGVRKKIENRIEEIKAFFER